jgi:hypothetical protein
MRSTFSSLAVGASLLLTCVSAGVNNAAEQEPMRAAIDPLKYKAACPDYKNYATRQQYVKIYASRVRGEN